VVFVARRALDSCGEDGAARIALVHDVLALAGERLRIDIEEFEAASAEAERAPSVERYRQAIDLYAGELLPEDRFEEWAAARRQALSERHLTLLVDLARLHEEAGDPDAALAAPQRALVDEPLHECAHRELCGSTRSRAAASARWRSFICCANRCGTSLRMSLMSRPAAFTGTS
jgi:DNA-binding SARP family transcriptional activator